MFKKWVVLVSLLYLPMIYFVAASVLANKIRQYSSSVLGLKAFTLDETGNAQPGPAVVPVAAAN